MAEEIENQDNENSISAQGNDGHIASGDEKTGAPDDTTETDEEQISPGKPEMSAFSSFLKYRFILVSLLIIIIPLSYAGFKYRNELLDKLTKKEKIIHLSDINGKNLTEEILQPFFIPIGEDASQGMIRIDFSVIWDGLASVRFKKSELLIRDKLFQDISSITKEEDPVTKREFLENEMGRIFREVIGVNDLVIRIKEINYF